MTTLEISSVTAHEISNTNFLLAKADYTVSNNEGTYTYNYQSGNDDGAGFRVGGYVNTKGDWYDYASGTKSVSLNAVFSFSKADDADEADADAFGYGMMTYSGDTVSVNTAEDEDPDPEPDPVDLYPTSIEVTRNTNAAFSFENAITVTSITWKWVDASNVQKGTGPATASDWTLGGDGKTLTINSTGGNNLTGVPVGNKVTLTVNTSGAPLTLTFTIK